MPALPLDEAGKYVAAAYLVFLALLLVYVGIMAGRLSRLERDLTQLNADAAARDDEREREQPKTSSSVAVVSQGDTTASSGRAAT
jgi:hypothetical protein